MRKPQLWLPGAQSFSTASPTQSPRSLSITARSSRSGWSFRLQKKKRNLVHLGPRTGWFLASFILGKKAIAAAHKEKLPVRILKVLDEAKRYPEGTAVRIEVHGASDVRVVKTLAKLKFEN